MSTRSQRRRQAALPPQRRRNAVAAWVVSAIALIGIATYAVIASHKVPGAAVSPTDIKFSPQSAVGTQAKPFSLQTGGVTYSRATLAGRPYLLEIFATWCPHCQRMTATLKDLRAKVPESRLTMLSVTGSPYAADSTPDNLVPENQQDVNRFDASYRVTWPTAFDRDLTVARTWGLTGFPTFYIVNRQGKIVYADSGEPAEKTLLAALIKAGA
ncbi:MAG: TlpA family protein disulfide reductase [Candidatus Eremiobacteraeota bacterium]|nr:TlpA family protein disulfide reductase [Candidatus Eremiobacteraeota bacterium]MBC5827037.1 TlpA family protein disulfide reductase [Candidatus Eremiobacteraeota bacterium]